MTTHSTSGMNQQDREMTGSDDVHFQPHFPLQSENSTTMRPILTQSRPSNKRSRISSDSAVCFPSIPQTRTMEHPVESINRASKNIVDGDYDGAIFLLTKTLKNIKLILSGDAKVTMPNKPDSVQANFQRSNANWMDLDCENKQEDSVPSKAPGAFEYDFLYSSPGTSSFLTTRVAIGYDYRNVCVFNNPLIVEGDSFDVALNARLCQELSCVAISNLALSHQLEAMSLYESHDVSSAAAYLQKALNLYEYSHQIFKNQDIPMRVPALHCMALVSNLGQIHHLIGNSPRAHQCNEYLLSVLMYTIDGGKGQDLRSLSTGDQIVDGFLSIVQHLIISEDCTASAA